MLDALVRAALSDPTGPGQAIMADWLEEQGDSRASALRAAPLWTLADGGGYGGDGGGGDGGDGDGGDGDGGGGYGGDGDGGDGGGGDGGDGYGGGGYGYGGDGYGGDGYGSKSLSLLKDATDMQNGYYILSIRAAYNPYVIIGECEVDGFEVIVKGAMCIRRFGGSMSLAQLAADGPASETQVLPASDVEYVFRPNISRAIVANPDHKKKWEKKSKERNT